VIFTVPVVYAQGTSNLFVTLDKTEYHLGDTLKISGTTNPHFNDHPVRIYVSNDDGKSILISNIYADQNGNFTQNILLDIDSFSYKENTIKVHFRGEVTNLEFVLDESNIEEPSSKTEHDIKKSNGGCFDCVPPTLGYDRHGIKKVDNGICINKSCIDGGKYHTYFTQNTFLYYPTTVSLIYYENYGPHNIKIVQLGVGSEHGSPINKSEALIEVWLNRFSNDMYNPTIKEVKIIDPDGLLYFTNISVEIVPCLSGSCLKTDFVFSYTKVPDSSILVTNAIDWNGSAINNYIMDGLDVISTSKRNIVIQFS